VEFFGIKSDVESGVLGAIKTEEVRVGMEGGGNRGLREALGEGNVLARSHAADPTSQTRLRRLVQSP